MAPTRAEAAWAALAVALIAAYGGAFAPWLWLTEHVPAATLKLLPPGLALLLFVIVILRLAPHFRDRARVTGAWLVAAVLLALAGLLLADPAFPAKRVHVFQYALLALVVRQGLAGRLGGAPLVAMSALVAALLGVHDELVQGIRPERYFGLSDILVNSVSAISGACLGAALSQPDDGRDGVALRAWLAIGLALVGLAALIIGLTQTSMPLWAWLPAPLCLAAWLMLVPPGRRWPAALPVWLACGAVVEPAIAHLAGLPFA
jgi:VanZ family protein